VRDSSDSRAKSFNRRDRRDRRFVLEKELTPNLRALL
jgi:hypothetical protein